MLGMRACIPRVVHALTPIDKAEKTKTLWLDLDGDVEVLNDCISPEWHPAGRPQEHHGRRYSFGRLGAVASIYLRKELDAPENRADRHRETEGLL